MSENWRSTFSWRATPTWKGWLIRSATDQWGVVCFTSTHTESSGEEHLALWSYGYWETETDAVENYEKAPLTVVRSDIYASTAFCFVFDDLKEKVKQFPPKNFDLRALQDFAQRKKHVFHE